MEVPSPTRPEGMEVPSPTRPERMEVPSPTRPERAEAPSPGHRPGYVVCKPVALKGQKLYHTSLPNPGIRNSHHIPHYIISRTLYIPLQTNALCDALSDWQYIVMFYPQLIG